MNKKLKIPAFATKRLKSNAKRRQRNLNALKNVAANAALHAKRTRDVKTTISRTNVHASPKEMKERNAKVLNQLKARRNAIVKAKQVKPNRQFQNQALLSLVLCNLWLVYQLSTASGKKSIPVRNAAVIAVTIAVMIAAATAATTVAVTAVTIAATTAAAIAAASLAVVATAVSHAAAVATSAAAPVATAATVATIARAVAAAVRSPRHNSIPLLWPLLPRLPPPARNTTEVEVLSLRLK